MTKTRSLTKLKPMKKERNFFVAAIDSETIGLDGEAVLFQSYHELWDFNARIYYKASELLEDIFSLDNKLLSKTVWYAHNAEYDWRYLIAAFKEYTGKYIFEPIERMTGKFFQINVRDKDTNKIVTTFRDSMALYPNSLHSFTKSFAPDHVKQDIDLKNKTFDIKNPKHIEYAKNDVVSLVIALQNFDAVIYSKYKTHIKGTTASTAFNAWLRFAPEDEYHSRQSKEAETFFRSCYYGGLVQLNAEYGREYTDIISVDINSSYPASMRLGVPKGKAIDTFKYVEGKPGFYEIEADIDDNAIMPIIPHRNDRGQLCWPTGKFKTYVSSLEIEYARSLGFKIKVIGGYYFPEGLTDCFRDFVDECERLRTEYRKTPTEIVVKLMQNSVYGKFGTKIDGRECIIDYDKIPEGYDLILDEETGSLIEHVYFRNIERDSEYMLPHYAAWITANSRILLDKAVNVVGRDNVLYRDTDSLSIKSGESDLQKAGLIGNKYGQFKVEKVMSKVKFHAPKCYTYEIDGVKHAVYKGIPRNMLVMTGDRKRDEKRDRLISALHSGEQQEVFYHSSNSLQTFLKKGRMFTDRRRKSTSVYSVYGHEIRENKFRPKRISM